MHRESTAAHALAATFVLLVAGCAAPVPATAPPPAPEPMRAMVLPSAPPAVPLPAPTPPRTEVHPLEAAVAHAERVRGLPASELATEIQRLGETSYTPLRATQLAQALAFARGPANASRAQALLQRVLADPAGEAQPLHPYARVLAAQIAEQRRVDEQAERQAQQLREAQRRIEQLNDRLEAVRAIERSLPGAPRAPAPRSP
ncbi:hypothetical protein [Ramlibacter pallidus]|uniref:DUF4398 domain-containing protein n=1 Tax=Ramlibacter pallidus TaxID=2780087 RepID=A0ABR9S143_9BURK|nr:hypothetical protein [Ramlibacter pallidus]MBE7367241.1 hypothetical protein [Ramlibacter pallidus]